MKIRAFFLAILLLLFSNVRATEYNGRVVSANGEPVSFATIYLINDPIVGTASGDDGSFTINTDYSADEPIIISFIGYERCETTLARLSEGDIVLKEQPIALQETVVTAKASKQKNKRKQMAQLLHRVYLKMQDDFPSTATKYKVVSDVRMNTEDTPWGMEQMIATVVNIPGIRPEGKDSVQLAGEYCKRFFRQQIRDRADVILEGNSLNNNVRKMATEVDSGIVVHKALWSMGNVKYDFERSMNDIKHWSVSNESESETVLTHIDKKNYMGIFKYEYKRHYILNSDNLSVLRFSEELNAELYVPFGYKFKPEDLELLNLLNMSEQKIEKFRLRRAKLHVNLNTIYKDNIIGADNSQLKKTIQEKNLSAQAQLLGTKKKEIPVDVKATQKVTSVQLNAKTLPKSAFHKRVQREIVPIF